MPAPVAFTVSLAPIPIDFSGSLQEFATAIADRLTVTPASPWSSFLNGSVIPTSDNGPLLYQGVEWRVFDPTLGAYTFQRLNGTNLVAETVSVNALADGTAGSVFVYSSSGRPSELTAASGVSGQVVTLVSGVPTWVNTFVPGAECFEVTLSTDQDINSNGSVIPVEFDTVRFQANVVFDTVLHRVPVVAGTKWFFYASLQVEDAGAASTDVQFVIDIRKEGASTGVSGVEAYTTAQTRFGKYFGGLVSITSSGYVDVSVTASEATPANPGFQIAGNATTTRFGGYRVI